jgi:FAD/FMN-containing dehydrogenase
MSKRKVTGMNIVQPSASLLARTDRAFPQDRRQQICGNDAADIAPYVTEERDLFHGRSPLVLRPGSTAEVSAICKLASEHRIALVPQGGNTGLVGGQTPHHGEVVISMRRMDKIRDIDTASNTMTCEAGVVLQVAQQRAGEVDRLFPLSLGAEGSCTIGGNLSTNAGGTTALAYGVAREMALGLEVVLADGRVPERAIEAEEGQYRLRFAQPLHRRRGHARHHHRGDPEIVSETARGGNRLCRPSNRRRQPEAARSRRTRPRARLPVSSCFQISRKLISACVTASTSAIRWRTSIPGMC